MAPTKPPQKSLEDCYSGGCNGLEEMMFDDLVRGFNRGAEAMATYIQVQLAISALSAGVGRAVMGAFEGAVASRGGFSAIENGVINEVRGIPLGQLRGAFEAGGAELSIDGRTIVVEPGLPASGMTLFGENGFVLGREAFASDAELTKTLLHETYRLTTSQAASGVSGALAGSETNAAFSFAERAFNAVFK